MLVLRMMPGSVGEVRLPCGGRGGRTGHAAAEETRRVPYAAVGMVLRCCGSLWW